MQKKKITKPIKAVKKALSYCEIASNDDDLKDHHQYEHGFSCRNTAKIFEYLMLEIMMAGLSWKMIIRKRKAFQEAFASFDPYIVAKYNNDKVEELMQNTNIIRSNRKILATIHNAKAIVNIEKQGISFAEWLDSHHPLPVEDWLKLLKNDFKFIGLETVKEFLTGIGYLSGAHEQSCPIFKKALATNPPYKKTSKV